MFKINLTQMQLNSVRPSIGWFKIILGQACRNSGMLEYRIPARYDICRRFRSYLRTTLIYLHTTSSYYQMSHLSEIFRFFCHRTQCGCLPLVLEARLPTVIATLVTFRSRLSSFTRSTCTANRSRDILLACHVFTEELIAI